MEGRTGVSRKQTNNNWTNKLRILLLIQLYPLSLEAQYNNSHLLSLVIKITLLFQQHEDVTLSQMILLQAEQKKITENTRDKLSTEKIFMHGVG